MMGELEPLILTVCGAILGAVFMVFMTPDPAPRQDCRIHVVERKEATAYVLKPPTVPPPEPVVIHEKCPPPPAPQTVVAHEACKPENIEKTDKKEEIKATAKPKPAHARGKAVRRHKGKGRTR